MANQQLVEKSLADKSLKIINKGLDMKIDKNRMTEIFFGVYSDGKEGGSDGKEGSKDSGRDHLSAFSVTINEVNEIDYQF